MFSVSQHFHDAVLLEDEVAIERWLSETSDAYMTISGPNKGLLPPMRWNGSLRKAYTVMAWIRLRRKESAVSEEENKEDAGDQNEGAQPDAEPPERLIYSFETTNPPKDAAKDTANNVRVNCNEWKIEGDAAETTITAYNNLEESVTTHLSLQLDTWHLIVLSHVFPYLKRPTWTIAVQGRVISSGPLSYPVVDSTMDDCTFLSNVVNKDPVELDVSSISIYPNIAVGTTIQALCAAMGPQLPLQTADGRVVPTLPPVCNWSKGSSLEGPKVGIPLTVHAAALELQQLSGTAVLSFKATSARMLGEGGDQNRVIWEFKRQQGTTIDNPRVGLVQPSEPPEEDDDPPQFYVTGHVRLYRALDTYLASLSRTCPETSCENLSIIMQEQKFSSAVVVNFFRCICPPTRAFEMNSRLYDDSLKQLYHMYREDGKKAAQWIRWLAAYVRIGGARVHEELLQAGTLHVLATSLRCSLVRAAKYQAFTATGPLQAIPSEEGMVSQTKHDIAAPSHVPDSVVKACVDLIEACCGPESTTLHDLLPGDQIIRTSDLSLTALYGFALDWDIWGASPEACAAIAKCIATRFGGTCITSGYVLRSQMSVQHFLDAVRLRIEVMPPSLDVQETATDLSLLLQSMLLSSLVNRRNIAQGERDIEACVNALTDATLGHSTSHAILNALVGILVWCEALPPEAALLPIEPCNDEERKMQVASRLGRNLLISQFHEVVAPMLLSRTAFSGDRTMLVQRKSKAESSRSKALEIVLESMSWENHWRHALVLFTWITSVAGPEGLTASGSCGQLLFASALAGSLRGALDGADKTVLTSLFMPPPGMSMLIGSTFQNEWSYTDLLSERLHIMMPLIPGMIVSLLSVENENDKVSLSSIQILAHALTSLGGAFHRVYGGTVHSTRIDGNSSRAGNKQVAKASINTAKSFVPYLLVIGMVFEKQIRSLELPKDQKVEILRPVIYFEEGASSSVKRRSDSDSWVDVSSTEESIQEVLVDVPSTCMDDPTALASYFLSCQRSTLQTAAGLMLDAMALGGAGTILSIWQSVLATLKDSGLKRPSSNTGDSEDDSLRISDASVSKGVLCRLVAFTLRRALKRRNPWDLWTPEVGAAVAKTCVLVEEKRILSYEPATDCGDDQIILLCVVLEILAYGREATGWCQLPLPHMPASGKSDAADLTATSQQLLPVLQPCFRILLSSLQFLASAPVIKVPQEDGGFVDESLFKRVLEELDKTLTASIVGLTFAGARDTALGALAELRRALQKLNMEKDEDKYTMLTELVGKIAEELRVRYESERRLRETALFDAYEGENGRTASDSQAVERLVFGGDGLGLLAGQNQVDESSVNKASPNPKVSEDFVLFHEPEAMDGTGSAKLGFPEYEGLGLALENMKAADSEASGGKSDTLLHLAKFLDSWDAVLERDFQESELVDLFDVKLDISDQLDSIESEASIDDGDQGADTAADAMSNFFEFAAAEKSRLKEITVRFMPIYRFSRLSYTERFCWSEYMSFGLANVIGFEWERGVSDGNRDIRSRLASLPSFPQFRPYIPGYLDHGSTSGAVSGNSSQNAGQRPTGEHDRRLSTMPIDKDVFTKTLLQAGELDIVDITKKGTMEEDDEVEQLGPPAEKFESIEEGESLFAEEGGNSRHDDPKSLSTGLENETEHEDDYLPDFLPKGHHNITTSSFSTPPDNSSSSMSLMQSAASGLIEKHLEACLHVKAEGSRPCSILLTSTHLILEYDGEGYFDGELLAAEEEAERNRIIEDGGGLRDASVDEKYQRRAARRQREVAALRPKSIRYNLSEISHIYLRRYRLRDSSLEIFFIPSGGTTFGGFGIFSSTCSLFLDFGPGHEGHARRDDAAFSLMRRSPPQALKQWPDRANQFLHEQLQRLTVAWAEGRITNFDYLLHLNMLSGRTYNDICQYPVFPWVLGNYGAEELPDLNNRDSFRDLSKPVGALNPERLDDFIERFNTFADPSIPPFMYGSHYSTSAGVVLHFLVRLHPFAGLHRQLQGGYFDVADRLFSSIPRTWGMCTGSSAAEVKEITPEWYCNPSFLRNSNGFVLGSSQDGEQLGDVILPPWANGSPEKFIETMRAALESDICSEMLPDWIDLIFGYKQQGPEAIKANNVYFYLTYYGAVDVASIKDEALRQATELQIAHFGQCPMQLFRNRPHVRRLMRRIDQMPFFQLISAHTQKYKPRQPGAFGDGLCGEPQYLPFDAAPLSHWVHLDAPPPGPHAPLIAVRFAGNDRCLAIDGRGIFHTFRWTWRPQPPEPNNDAVPSHFDRGCFVAQRELQRFRKVPRLLNTSSKEDIPATVAITKTLFAGRTVFLVLSDADSVGGLGMQLVDPAKGSVKGEVLVPHVHSARITCIATDPIGTAAGHSGVGGELAVVGSEDGNASIWRFMSSHFLPLRPRLHLRGHGGSPIFGVALSAPTQLAASISRNTCCLHSLTNGTLIRSFSPPLNGLDLHDANLEVTTKFATSKALALSVLGFVVCVCENTIRAGGTERNVISLSLFTVDAVYLGSKPLEPWRGLPHSIECIPDGTGILVCSGRGVTIHRISACSPLDIIDEWHVTEFDDLSSRESIPAAWAIDLGPRLNRPVVAAAACSNGALRLHALPGISAWSERHRSNGLSQTVGNALAKPAQQLKNVMQGGLGIGKHIAGMGRDIGREVTADVKERGVSGFLGGMFRKHGS